MEADLAIYVERLKEEIVRRRDPGPSPHTAFIQWIVPNVAGLIRVFQFGRTIGDPYTWAATLAVTEPGTVEIMGAMEAPTFSEI